MTTRREILLLLRKHPGATVSSLASRTGLTNMGVRRHLDALAAEGLAESAPASTGGVGRPPAAWRLTAAGVESFPRRYDTLALEILDEVAETAGPVAVDATLARRTEKLVAQYESQLAHIPGVDDRIRRLAALRDEDGYVVELEDLGDGEFVLVENNCAVHRVARQYPTLCAMELTLFRRCLGPGVDVTRETHALGGDAVCRYRIQVNGHDSGS